ncbi:hypothetical protein [Promicromonospora sp. NFX87]|uniref:hypothetical protein n=1 Tax=Promicromonospora sp. NFX87 TaxID=3402691 RepID=UPI003AFB2C0F
MRVVVHEPTVEAPEEAAQVATAVLAALAAELSTLSDGGGQVAPSRPVERATSTALSRS